jgi:hypothetical protein
VLQGPAEELRRIHLEVRMNIYEKLLEIQREVDRVAKDGENQSDKYSYASGTAVLSVIRPLMNKYALLLIPSVTSATLHEGQTKSGTTRFMTEMFYDMAWVDVDSGETLHVQSYAQGVDLAGERSVGKAGTYNEKIFLLKFFHIPTDKDDPDNDGRTQGGEKKQRGTQAAKETADFHRAAIAQIAKFFATGDATGNTTEATVIQYYTKNDAQVYAGVTSVAEITDAALPVVYSKITKGYQKRTGKEFVLEAAE